MNTSSRRFLWLLPAFLLLGTLSSVRAQLAAPIITAIRLEETNLVVSIQVPTGLRKVTIEGRERLSAGNWQPRAVAYPDGHLTLTLRLPQTSDIELLRVRGDEATTLPEAFYTGVDTFLGEPGGASDPYYWRFFAATTGLPPSPPPTPSTETADPGRAVAESDIYALRGSTLYFFNQTRGLQVLDVTDPDQPVLRGTVPLPAAGEQMYLLGQRHVILLARDQCLAAQESQVKVTLDNGGQPQVIASLPVAGIIQESRLVGTALYVASQTYRPADEGKAWEIGTLVASFDLSDPNAPVPRNSLWYPGSGHVVTATDTLFFVVTVQATNWRQSIIQTVDITSADGTIRSYETILPAGLIKDKFKLNYDAAILTAISETQNPATGRLVTRLETFRLNDPRAVSPGATMKLGEVELGHGEQLHATRFDGDRVYVVTFLRIDPLFVVSIADPAHPRVSGEVEVPGWSTFIAPLGDRLVTVGVEGSRVAVSLFDVVDPAHPALLSRVRLGERYSSSEANWDEKAFTVLPADGLILVPFSEYGASGTDNKVQLIDLKRNVLTARGVIEHNLQPRRATIYEDRILSLSGRQYLSVDASDRDHPVVRGELELARPIDRVFAHGAHLVELEVPINQGAPVLRVASTSVTEVVLSTLTVTNAPVWGATLRGDYLYLLQGWTPAWGPMVPLADVPGYQAPKSQVLLTVVSLQNLPRLEIIGQALGSADTELWGGANLQAVWPQEDVLVWVLATPFYHFYPMQTMSFAAPAALWRYPFWGNGQGSLLAFQVAQPSAPRLSSSVMLDSPISSAYTIAGLIYLSHQSSYFGLPYPRLPMPVPERGAILPVELDKIVAPPDPIGTWSQRYYLDVIDYADPGHPVKRRPVNIPGTLVGVSHGGELVYTTGRQWKTDWTNDGLEYLSALAYDGVAAHLVDSLPLSPNGFHPIVVKGSNVFVGGDAVAKTGPAAPSPAALETWTVTMTGKFERLGSLALEQTLQTLHPFAGLLAGRQTDGVVVLFGDDHPEALRVLGRERIGSCIGFDLKVADGNSSIGLWIPLGIYGALPVPISSP